MPDAPQWAQVKTDINCRLRRGAWHLVTRMTPQLAVIEVNQRTVTVPKELLHILPTRPEVWAVVPRPLDAVDLPLSWGDKYAVCPSCGARAPLTGTAPTMRCARCGGEFKIGS
jgi:hypothetical protein